MKYQFVCQTCDYIELQEHSHEKLPQLKSEGVSCTQCGQKSLYVFDPSTTSICFKGFQWADKNHKEKVYRENRSKYLKVRQKINNYTPKLAPNYKGERTKSWKEARQEAASEGKLTTTYDHLVRQEESKS